MADWNSDDKTTKKTKIQQFKMKTQTKKKKKQKKKKMQAWKEKQKKSLSNISVLSFKQSVHRSPSRAVIQMIL